MKKSLSMLLALLLVTLPFTASALQTAPASEQNERIGEVADLVEAYLDAQEYRYERNDDSETYTFFTLEFELDNTFGDVDVEITVYDDLVTVLSYALEDVPEARIDAAALYMTRVNWVTFYANFNMDMENGHVATYSFMAVEDMLPGEAELDVVFHSVLWAWEDYGGGLYDVAFEGMEPKDAFEAAQAALDAA